MPSLSDSPFPIASLAHFHSSSSFFIESSPSQAFNNESNRRLSVKELWEYAHKKEIDPEVLLMKEARLSVQEGL